LLSITKLTIKFYSIVISSIIYIMWFALIYSSVIIPVVQLYCTSAYLHEDITAKHTFENVSF